MGKPLYTCENEGVLMVVNQAGLKRIREHDSLFTRLTQMGTNPKEAGARASHEYPYPPMITFAINPGMPLEKGDYGHGGTSELFDLLLEAGNHVEVGVEMQVFNSAEKWNLPKPTREDYLHIFGRSALKILDRQL